MKHVYPKNRFSPARILHEPAYQNLNKSGKNIYLLLCRRSYLVKKSPTRRYSVWTYKQIGKQVNLSAVQVQRIMKKLMAEMLIYRWYAGDSGSTTSNHGARPPRYEIPASKEMIGWWRRTRKIGKTTFNQGGEEMKKVHVCPACDMPKVYYRKTKDDFRCRGCKAVFVFSVVRDRLTTLNERFTRGG